MDATHVEATGFDHVGDAEDRTCLGLSVDQAMEDVHVAEHEAGLLGRHHQIAAAQSLTRSRCHEQGHDAIERRFHPCSRT